MPNDRPPIFIVGVPRSGTTLLAAMVGAHSQIGCGPETQFFHKLTPDQIHAAVTDRLWPHRAVRVISSLTLAKQNVVRLFGLDRRQIGWFLLRRKPSVTAMLESLTLSYARRAGKARWAEKTPNHLLHLDAIRAEWPTAPIVRIVRDPRDTASSLRQLPWASDSVLDNCRLWNEWHAASRDFFRNDSRATTLRLEDLLQAPEHELRRLCAFIDEPYEPSMLDTRRTGAAIASEGEPWKAGVSEAIDRERVYLWRTELPPDVLAAASACCSDGIREFGYPLPEGLSS